MFYLVLVSPLLVLGFLVLMQLFETWALGDPDPPRQVQPDPSKRPQPKTAGQRTTPRTPRGTNHHAKLRPDFGIFGTRAASCRGRRWVFLDTPVTTSDLRGPYTTR